MQKFSFKFTQTIKSIALKHDEIDLTLCHKFTFDVADVINAASAADVVDVANFANVNEVIDDDGLVQKMLLKSIKI